MVSTERPLQHPLLFYGLPILTIAIGTAARLVRITTWNTDGANGPAFQFLSDIEPFLTLLLPAAAAFGLGCFLLRIPRPLRTLLLLLGVSVVTATILGTVYDLTPPPRPYLPDTLASALTASFLTALWLLLYLVPIAFIGMVLTAPTGSLDRKRLRSTMAVQLLISGALVSLAFMITVIGFWNSWATFGNVLATFTAASTLGVLGVYCARRIRILRNLDHLRPA